MGAEGEGEGVGAPRVGDALPVAPPPPKLLREAALLRDGAGDAEALGGGVVAAGEGEGARVRVSEGVPPPPPPPPPRGGVAEARGDGEGLSRDGVGGPEAKGEGVGCGEGEPEGVGGPAVPVPARLTKAVAEARREAAPLAVVDAVALAEREGALREGDALPLLPGPPAVRPEGEPAPLGAAGDALGGGEPDAGREGGALALGASGEGVAAGEGVREPAPLREAAGEGEGGGVPPRGGLAVARADGEGEPLPPSVRVGAKGDRVVRAGVAVPRQALGRRAGEGFPLGVGAGEGEAGGEDAAAVREGAALAEGAPLPLAGAVEKGAGEARGVAEGGREGGGEGEGAPLGACGAVAPALGEGGAEAPPLDVAAGEPLPPPPGDAVPGGDGESPADARGGALLEGAPLGEAREPLPRSDAEGSGDAEDVRVGDALRVGGTEALAPGLPL
jgi:hypothetical protein